MLLSCSILYWHLNEDDEINITVIAFKKTRLTRIPTPLLKQSLTGNSLNPVAAKQEFHSPCLFSKCRRSMQYTNLKCISCIKTQIWKTTFYDWSDIPRIPACQNLTAHRSFTRLGQTLMAQAWTTFSRHSSGPCCKLFSKKWLSKSLAGKKKTKHMNLEKGQNLETINLANPGVVRGCLSVSPGDEPEIDNRAKICDKQLRQLIHNEVCTVWTQRFVVQRHANSVIQICSGQSLNRTSSSICRAMALKDEAWEKKGSKNDSADLVRRSHFSLACSWSCFPVML